MLGHEEWGAHVPAPRVRAPWRRPAWLRGARGRIGVVSAVLFGLVHTEQGAVGVVLAAVDGAVFGVLRVACRTLWAPVLVHGFVNTIGFVAFFLAGPLAPLW